MTFLDKIEVAFADTKAWLLKEFGDHMTVHNAMSDLKTKVLEHTAEHFGEDVEPGSPGTSSADTIASDDNKAP